MYIKSVWESYELGLSIQIRWERNALDFVLQIDRFIFIITSPNFLVHSKEKLDYFGNKNVPPAFFVLYDVKIQRKIK